MKTAESDGGAGTPAPGLTSGSAGTTLRSGKTALDSGKLDAPPAAGRGPLEATRRPIEPPPPDAYAFGPYVLEPVRRVLRRDGRVVPITAKTFDVLLALIEHRGRIVGKDELLSRVWPDTSVQENNLVRQISSLRRLLDQRPDQHDYIVTIPGQGYQFVAEVREVPPAVPDDAFAVIDSTADPAGAAVPAGASPAGRRRRPFVAAGVAAAAVIAAALAGVALLRSTRSPEEPPRVLERVTFDDAAVARESAWSPDGEWVVYASDRSGNLDLWRQRLGDPNPVPLTMSEAGDSQPDWSPDGRWIVFRSERDGGGLFVMPAGGGHQRRIAAFGYHPRWSPEGTSILFTRSGPVPGPAGVYVVGTDGRPPRPVAPELVGGLRSVQAAWHPDGRRISIWATMDNHESVFFTTAAGGGSATPAVLDDAVRRSLQDLSPGRFVWARSRRFVYFEARNGDTQNIWRVRVDPDSERWIGGPERVTTGTSEESNVALSPDGTRLLFTSTSSRTRLWAFPLDAAAGRLTSEPRPLTAGRTGEVDFDARADGSTVAYRAVRAGRNELWERSIAEGRERLLLSSADWKYITPRWSPDGARLAYSQLATRDHSSLTVGVLNADGSGHRALTYPGDVEMQAYDWSQDGKAILGSCRFKPSEHYATCLVPVAAAGAVSAGSVRVVASDPRRNLYNQRFSPDQRWITFLAHNLQHASTSTVYVTPATGGRWRAVTEGTWFDDKPRWGPDGRLLYFVSHRTGVPNVWARRFDPVRGVVVGEPFQVTSFSSGQFMLTRRIVQMDIAITATDLLLPISESRAEIWMLDGVDR